MTALSESIDELRTNERQWEAFTTEGHCVVLAPPGSGKTKLLATRVAFDVANKIPIPHGAACVTLTNPAAAELRGRVKRLGLRSRHNIFIGTVHSFALNAIVIPFSPLAGRPELTRVQIASSLDENAAFTAAIEGVAGSSFDRRYVRSTIEFNRKRMASDEQWAQSGPVVQAAAREYLAYLHARGLIDFNELIQTAVEFVEGHSVIRRALSAKFPHFYVDEYQDLAPGLDRLVKALCFDYYNAAELFAVGDPDQAVFGFTGTRPELLIELSQRPEVHPVVLEQNYRCGVEIIRIANRIRGGDERPAVGSHKGGLVTATRCPGGFSDQSAHSAGQIQTVARAGTPFHEISVICPTNAQCGQVAQALTRDGIPVFYRNTDIYRVTQATAFLEGCAAWATRGREGSNYRLANLLQQWRSLLGPRAARRDEVALTSTLLDFQERVQENARSIIDEIGAAGLYRALRRPALAADAAETAKMLAAFSTGELRSETVGDLADKASKVDRVEVTTMSSSKGLEFDVVLILGMDQNRVPFFASIGKPEQMAEERRKFYVSLTRARNEVHIYYSGFVEWSKSRDFAGPSEFLIELGLAD